MTYDLLLTNGRVIDPAQGLDAVADVAIREGRIAAVRPHLAGEAAAVIDATGRLACPGLIDLHAHAAESIISFGLAPDAVGVRAGVTAVGDAGSVGYANFPAFRRFIIERTDTDVFCFLHLSPVGEVILPEIGYEAFDRAAFLNTVEANRDVIRGIKIRVIAEVVANPALDVVGLALGLGAELGLPVMVHIGAAATPQASEAAITDYTRRMLTQLRAGDIITHAYTHKAGRIFERDGRPLPEVEAALARGVLLDIGSAHAHISFETARAAIARGYLPHTLSTDLTTLSYANVSLALVMSEFMALGISLADVIGMTTANPAAVLHESHQRGSLREGMLADLTLLELRTGEFTFTDGRAGNTIAGKALLAPVKTVKAGVVFECAPSALESELRP
jgi:dihydroorotase